MWWCIQIGFTLLLLVKLGEGATNDPSTSKSVGDDLAISMETYTQFIVDGGRLEVPCVLRNEVTGSPPNLKFSNPADNAELKSNDRLNITITKDFERKTTTGLFIWDPIYVGDNANIESVHCQNADTKSGKTFKIKVIPEKSVPVVSIVNVVDKVYVDRGATKTFECKVTGIKIGVVKDFGAKWLVDDLKSRGKLPHNAKEEGSVRKSDINQNTTTIISPLTIENVDVDNYRTWYCVAKIQFEDFEVVRRFNAKIEVLSDESLSEVIKKKKGEDVTFNCKGSASVPLSVKWYKVDEYSKEEVEIPGGVRYKSAQLDLNKLKEDAVNNSILEIRDLTFKDRSQYRCNAQYKYRNVTITYTLRVSDPLGPLWPVVGIVVETIILFIVIWYSEMFAVGKKSKSSKNKPLSEGDEKAPPPKSEVSKKKDPDTEDVPLMNSNEDGALANEVPA